MKLISGEENPYQFTHELDVAQHFSLGQVLGVLLVRVEATVIGHFFILLRDLGAIFKFISALFEQQFLESAGDRIWWFEVRSFFHEEFAQLCIHRRIFRFIEGFFENLKFKKNKTLISRVFCFLFKIMIMFIYLPKQWRP